MNSSGKFFVPIDDRCAGGLGRPREGGREQADDDRDPEGDRERRLGGTPRVLANHCSSFRGMIADDTSTRERPLGVTAI